MLFEANIWIMEVVNSQGEFKGSVVGLPLFSRIQVLGPYREFLSEFQAVI